MPERRPQTSLVDGYTWSERPFKCAVSALNKSSGPLEKQGLELGFRVWGVHDILPEQVGMNWIRLAEGMLESYRSA